AVLDFEVILKQSARRRSGRMRSVFIEGAAMTRAHKQVRLLKPANGAAEVRAVDCEDLKSLSFDSAHPARDIARRPIPRSRERIAIRRQPRFTGWKLFQRAERDPRIGWSFAPEARKDKTDDRNAYERRCHHVESGAKLQQKTPARRSGIWLRTTLLLINRHLVFLLSFVNQRAMSSCFQRPIDWRLASVRAREGWAVARPARAPHR